MVCEGLIFRHCSCLLQGNNNFFVEKNPTIVTFPLKGTNLTDRCVGWRVCTTPNGSRFGFTWLHPSGLSTCKPRDKICWDLRPHRRDDERCLGLPWQLQTTPERIWWQTFAMMESRKEEPTKCRHRYWIWIRIIYALHQSYICIPYAVHCKNTYSDSESLCFLCLSLSLSDETLLFKRIRET